MWGIVAPNIVGTLLAGNNLVIESAKQDGGVAVFRVDASGCVLHNSDFSITSDATNSHILLDAEHGIVVGKYPVIGSNGTVNKDNYRFWVDQNGNLFFKGTLKAADGEFSGKVTAREGYIGNGSQGWTIASTAIYNGKSALTNATQGVYIGTDGIALGNATNYVRATNDGTLTANNVDISGKITATSGYIGGISGWTIGSTYIYNGKSSLNSTTLGVYIGTDGIALGSGGNYAFKVTSSGLLTATNADIKGAISASSGNIGDWTIGYGALYNDKSSFADTTSGIYLGVDGISVGGNSAYVFKVDSIGRVTASYITATGGTIGGFTIKDSYLCTNNHTSINDTAYAGIYLGNDGLSILGSGGSYYLKADIPNKLFIFKGTIYADAGEIGGCSIRNGTLQIDSAHITSGTINSARIPNLSANKITSGTLNANNVTITNLTVDAAQITSGTIATARIPNLSADKITSGTINANNVNIANLTVDAAQITSGTISSARIGTLSANKISGGTISGCAININNVFTVTSSGILTINSDKAIYIYADEAGIHSGWHYGLTTSIPYMNNTIDQWLMYFAHGIMIGFGNNDDWLFG